MLVWWALENDKQELPNLDTTFEIEHIYARSRQDKEGTLSTKSKIESLFDYSGNDGLNIQQPLTGDLNNDGIVNNDDMTILKSELLNTTGNYDPVALDINGDGVFDVVDLVRMKKIISHQS